MYLEDAEAAVRDGVGRVVGAKLDLKSCGGAHQQHAEQEGTINGE